MKRLLTILAISSLLYSCSEKSLETPGAVPPANGGTGTPNSPTTPVALGTLTFDLDGAAQNYSFYTSAYRVPDPNGGPGSAIGILGVKDAAATAQFTLYLVSDSAFKPGLYVDSASSTGMFAAMGLKTSAGSFGTNDDSSAPTTCIVTSADANSIAGTFKGSVDLANADGTFGKKLQITNGKFNVKFP